MSSSLWVDGALVPAATARISALDTGFRSGLGVFETFRVDDGRALRPQAHLTRLRDGAHQLGFDIEVELLRAAVAATVAANGHLGAHLALRITCSAGPIDPDAPFPGATPGPPTVVVTAQVAAPLRARPALATAVSTDLRRELAGTKHTSYLVSLVAQQAAATAGCSDALLCTPSGAPLEAATANLLVVADGVVSTPPAGAGILAGITRGALLELARGAGLAVEEREVGAAELAGADEALLTSAVRGVRALTHVDSREIGSGRAGPVTTQLAAAYRELLNREAEAVTPR